jgi:hypothetical protein
VLPLSERDTEWLGALVAPVSAQDFIARYWAAEALLCRGASDRFSRLLSWSDLNAVLEHHWRETYRFRLAVRGRDLDPESYADLDGYTPRVRAKDLTDHLREGATLSFDAIDELHPPLTRLAECFERCFQGGTKINIYAGWRALHGLDLHRDNQEIFILQLDGRKRWLLYGFSIDSVDREALRAASVPPAGARLDQVIEPGDLLYIPRGCYHLAMPMNEPTLHLTIGVKVPQAKDVVAWMAARAPLRAIETRDVPTLGSAADRVRFSAMVSSSAASGLDADLVAQYLRENGSNRKPRPSFSLPFSATASGLPAGADFVVRLNPPIPELARDQPDDVMHEWWCGRHRCRFPHSMRWMIASLADGEPRRFRAVADSLAAHFDETAVRLLLGMLVRENLVSIRPGSEPPP